MAREHVLVRRTSTEVAGQSGSAGGTRSYGRGSSFSSVRGYICSVPKSKMFSASAMAQHCAGGGSELQRERERERERARERASQREREPQSQSQSQRVTERDGKRDSEKDRERLRESERDRQTVSQTVRKRVRERPRETAGRELIVEKFGVRELRRPVRCSVKVLPHTRRQQSAGRVLFLRLDT